jgi:hypothetical protein
MEVTVQKKKKAVLVLNWGSAPFGIEESSCRGKAYIPTNFEVETVAARRVWIARTRVNDGMVQYQFEPKGEPNKSSGWKKSPSGAFCEVNGIVHNKYYKQGSNGALIIGVTYPSLQEEILARFGKELRSAVEEPSSEMMTTVSTLKRNQQPFLEEVPMARRSKRLRPEPLEEPLEPMSLEADQSSMDQIEGLLMAECGFDEQIKDMSGWFVGGGGGGNSTSISLEPIPLEASHSLSDAASSTSSVAIDKTMDDWFDCEMKNKIQPGSEEDDFRAFSFEENDPDFLFSNDPLDFYV